MLRSRRIEKINPYLTWRTGIEEDQNKLANEKDWGIMKRIVFQILGYWILDIIYTMYGLLVPMFFVSEIRGKVN